MWAIAFPALNRLLPFKMFSEIPMIVGSFLAFKVTGIVGIIRSTISISLEVLTVRMISVLIIPEILLGYKFLFLELRLITVLFSLPVGYTFFLFVLFMASSIVLGLSYSILSFI